MQPSKLQRMRSSESLEEWLLASSYWLHSWCHLDRASGLGPLMRPRTKCDSGNAAKAANESIHPVKPAC